MKNILFLVFTICLISFTVKAQTPDDFYNMYINNPEQFYKYEDKMYTLNNVKLHSIIRRTKNQWIVKLDYNGFPINCWPSIKDNLSIIEKIIPPNYINIGGKIKTFSFEPYGSNEKVMNLYRCIVMKSKYTTIEYPELNLDNLVDTYFKSELYFYRFLINRNLYIDNASFIEYEEQFDVYKIKFNNKKIGDFICSSMKDARMKNTISNMKLNSVVSINGLISKDSSFEDSYKWYGGFQLYDCKINALEGK